MQDTEMVARTQERTQFAGIDECDRETTEQPSGAPMCGVRTRSGAPCDRAPEPDRRRCRLHGGAAGSGAPCGNRNSRRHGRYSAQSREIGALGRILNCVAGLATAQMALMNACSVGHLHDVEIAGQRVSRCMHRLRKAAVALDRVLVEGGDGDGRQLVERALRLTAM